MISVIIYVYELKFARLFMNVKLNNLIIHFGANWGSNEQNARNNRKGKFGFRIAGKKINL